MESLSSRDKDSDLTRAAFDKLLERLDSDRERAGEKYENVRRKLIKFFEWRGCPFPEDDADETVTRVAVKIDQGLDIRASDPYVYFHSVAQYVLKERWKEPGRDAIPFDSLLPSQHPAEDPVESMQEQETRQQQERRLECLNRCMEDLPPKGRELIGRYYDGEGGAKIENRKQLAQRLNIPMNALRIRAHRMRERLESCVTSCLEQAAA